MRKRYKFLVFFVCVLLINLFISSVKSTKEYEGDNDLFADNFIATIEDWYRIGADYQIDSDDNDTSYVRYNLTENTNKYLSYYTFQNLKISGHRGIVNITSIELAKAYYTIRAETSGLVFGFHGDWYNGSTWTEDIGYATTINEWHTPGGANITDILDTGEKINNLRLRFVTRGGGITDYPGRISYVKLKVLFTYTVTYIYPLRLILGLVGLILIIASPSVAVREIFKNRNWSMIGGCIAVFVIGYALVHAWLIP